MCSRKTLLLFFVMSAIPVAIILRLETSEPATRTYYYQSTGWFRESLKWDAPNNRFIASFFENGLGQIPLHHQTPSSNSLLQETRVVKDADLARNASLGLVIDHPRNRVLVAIADVVGNRYSAIAAYDLSTWERLFLTHLSGSGDEKTMADDVAVDSQGNAYITDAKASKIWKVDVNGKFLSIITSPLFTSKQWYKNLVALNGIIYHPDGYLLVIHTCSGNLFKIDTTKNDHEIKLVNVAGGPLTFGDGLEILSNTQIVVAGNPSGRLVESDDGWETAFVVGKFWGPAHRYSTAATVKDGKVYLSHLIGMGYPKKKHVLVEAVFS